MNYKGNVRVLPHPNWRSRCTIASRYNFIRPSHFIDRYMEGGKEKGRGGREGKTNDGGGKKKGSGGDRWMVKQTERAYCCQATVPPSEDTAVNKSESLCSH